MIATPDEWQPMDTLPVPLEHIGQLRGNLAMKVVLSETGDPLYWLLYECDDRVFVAWAPIAPHPPIPGSTS